MSTALARKFYTLIAFFVIGTACLWWGYAKGLGIGVAEEAERNKAAAEQLEKVIKDKNAELDRMSQEAAKESQAAETQIQIVYRDKMKEVIKYVEKNPAESSASIGAEWVRLHDNFAAEGRAEASAPAVGTDEARAGVTKADAIAVIGENYRLYHECRDRLNRLQDYHTKQIETVNGEAP